jgi:hypothetical protein
MGLTHVCLYTRISTKQGKLADLASFAARTPAGTLPGTRGLAGRYASRGSRHRRRHRTRPGRNPSPGTATADGHAHAGRAQRPCSVQHSPRSPAKHKDHDRRGLREQLFCVPGHVVAQGKELRRLHVRRTTTTRGRPRGRHLQRISPSSPRGQEVLREPGRFTDPAVTSA